ncbi:hypothetical protein [Devosia sp. SD17-2]|uniref:hypothetical protein n=1 Tax=Devosia sp. SD17-2 TaxID=2976459 RepID=UPI0023D7C6B4|nr:hypothetical protein [Devosia sp. SD17-2]WEJ31701.1 hypothetical protein NYQ88_12380 [Devosia sp. SD17-2]
MSRARIFTIGVVGHRWNRMDQRQEPQLTVTIGRLFAAIDEALQTTTIRLVTGLAEGADHVAAQAMPPRWHLLAVLPMPEKAYEGHLKTHGTGHPQEAIERLRELLARPHSDRVEISLATPDERYVAVQKAILADTNLLIAIWDGAGGAGTGGTNDSITKALANDTLVVWIDSDQDRNRGWRRITAMSSDGPAITQDIGPPQLSEELRR